MKIKQAYTTVEVKPNPIIDDDGIKQAVVEIQDTELKYPFTLYLDEEERRLLIHYLNQVEI